MIAADTNTWIAYLEGNEGPDTQLLDQTLEDRQVLMVPAVLTELLSDPNPSRDLRPILADLPLIEIQPGYWERAGALRRKVLSKGRKARLGDALIAQTCIDQDISLITRDRDFRAFVQAAGLRIALPAKQENTWPPKR
jgi:predicted nucleic acid-binding protein